MGRGSSGSHRVLIIGGGASGALSALHLLRAFEGNIRITIVEKRDRVGQGIAYGTANGDHLLNVRASNMSALPEVPAHFWNWLVKSGAVADPGCADPFQFVPRRVYGRYLEDQIEANARNSLDPSRLQLVQAACLSLREDAHGVHATLDDGTTRIADTAILATGLGEARQGRNGLAEDPWQAQTADDLDPDAPIVILGTGLTMVDYLLTIVGRGHTGPIHAISRRGVLPQTHRRVEAAKLDSADVPLGASVGYLTRWLRSVAAWHTRRGGDWRGAIDALRPFIQDIWLRLTPDSKRRFLRHARPWWDSHRHRMAPEVATRLRAALASGQLKVLAAKVVRTEPCDAGIRVTFRPRGSGDEQSVVAASLVDCQGMPPPSDAAANPLMADLLGSGTARLDDLGLGLAVSADSALVGPDGQPSSRLYAVGPLTRGVFWEITSVPDIRTQCRNLAARLARGNGIGVKSDARVDTAGPIAPSI